MGWLPLNNVGQATFLYQVELDSPGCSYSITDLVDVWTESLTPAQVVLRAKQVSPVLILDTQQDVNEFINALSGFLKYPKVFNPDYIEYSVKLLSHDFKWYFSPSKRPIEESRAILGNYTMEALKGISQMNVKLQECNLLSHQLAYHLKNMARMTHEPYVPRRYQQSYMDLIDAQESISPSRSLSQSQSRLAELPPVKNSVQASWERGAEILRAMDTIAQETLGNVSTPASTEQSQEEERREKLNSVASAHVQHKKRRF